MSELFTATYRDTGETMTRDGVPIVATRDEWATLGPVAGELGAAGQVYSAGVVPLYDGPPTDAPTPDQFRP